MYYVYYTHSEDTKSTKKYITNEQHISINNNANNIINDGIKARFILLKDKQTLQNNDNNCINIKKNKSNQHLEDLLKMTKTKSKLSVDIADDEEIDNLI